MSFSTSAMKCILQVLNVLFALSGLGLIIVASTSLHSSPPVYVIYMYIVGAISLISALLGVLGICRENICLTTLYAGTILFSLILQILGLIFLSDGEVVRQFAATTVDDAWLQEVKSPGAMNDTQQLYLCCGKTGPQNYLDLGRPTYPASCYPHMVVNQTTLYDTGCSKAVEAKLIDLFYSSNKSEWASLGISIIMLLFSVYLIWHFKEKKRRSNY